MLQSGYKFMITDSVTTRLQTHVSSHYCYNRATNAILMLTDTVATRLQTHVSRHCYKLINAGTVTERIQNIFTDNVATGP